MPNHPLQRTRRKRRAAERHVSRRKMDGLTFTAEMIKALAWPLAVLGIALLFRKQLIVLLQAMKKGKFGPAEFEFERGVKAIEATVTDLPSSPTGQSLLRDAAVHPRAAVLEAWLRLEDQAIELAMKRGLTNATARRYAPASIRAISQSGLLKESHLHVLEELQELRNRAAHDPDFSPDPSAVVSYARLAADLGKELEALAP